MKPKDIIDQAVNIMQEQIRKHAEDSKEKKLNLSETRALTDIAKTLVIIDKNSKENPDDANLIDNMTDDEIRKKAKEIMEKYQKENSKVLND